MKVLDGLELRCLPLKVTRVSTHLGDIVAVTLCDEALGLEYKDVQILNAER